MANLNSTEAEREEQLKRTEALAAKRRSKRQRQKARKAQGADEKAAKAEKEQGVKARNAFEDLLSELRMEEMAPESDVTRATTSAS